MSEYFKPLRRKIGVVTLVVACVFGASWLRSFWSPFELRFPNRVQEVSDVAIVQYVLRSTTTGLAFDKLSFFNHNGDMYAPKTDASITIHVMVPYVTIVGIPALLSALLLFGKPRAGRTVELPSELES